jgi:hypothetical protein
VKECTRIVRGYRKDKRLQRFKSADAREPDAGHPSSVVMARNYDSELTPQQVQRDGQSAISQDAPLRELHQEGASTDDEPAVQRPLTPELTDEEVAILCDIEKDGTTKPVKQQIIECLAGRGLIDTVMEGSLKRLKLTPDAQRLLSECGVGLNES